MWKIIINFIYFSVSLVYIIVLENVDFLTS